MEVAQSPSHFISRKGLTAKIQFWILEYVASFECIVDWVLMGGCLRGGQWLNTRMMIQRWQNCLTVFYYSFQRMWFCKEYVDCLLYIGSIKRLHLMLFHRRQHIRPFCQRWLNLAIKPLNCQMWVLRPPNTSSWFISFKWTVVGAFWLGVLVEVTYLPRCRILVILLRTSWYGIFI